MFGQFVIGPPGAGKTTYCHGMDQMLTALKRPHAVVNLDPANDAVPYDCAIDVRELVNTEAVMEELQLGPNGALVYSMEYIDDHFEWLEERIAELAKSPQAPYWIIDSPGQVELYAHHHVMNSITHKLLKRLDVRLACVHLVDATLCRDAHGFLSAVLVALTATTHLELPHVNVLSKCDLMGEHASELDFRLEYYCGVEDMSHLLRTLEENEHPLSRKFTKFNAELVDVIEDFNLVRFEPLDIQDKGCVLRVLARCDASNGRAFGIDMAEAEGNMCDIAIRDQRDTVQEYLDAFHEKYMLCPEEELEPAPPDPE